MLNAQEEVTGSNWGSQKGGMVMKKWVWFTSYELEVYAGISHGAV